MSIVEGLSLVVCHRGIGSQYLAITETMETAKFSHFWPHMRKQQYITN